MKKFIFLLLLLVLNTGCAAQQFERVEAAEPVFITITGVLAQNDNGTASIVQNNDYQRVYHFDAKKDMVEGWKYVVRLRLGHKDDLKNREIVSGVLVGYAIHPDQARTNAAKISRLGDNSPSSN